MELHKLIDVTLKKAIDKKQPNGTKITDYEKIEDYKAWQNSLEDEINSQIYGANIYKVSKLKTPRKELEKFLMQKVNNTNDNLSKYFIFISELSYKINDAKLSGITIERL